jgi:NTP pyrophosphatase (non-canonical NTP hydrolase)
VTDSQETLDAVLLKIKQEVASAEAKWPAMNSAHEAYAVLLEEVGELWDHVKTNQKRRDVDAMRTEAIQVAAMAVRFVRDVCDLHRGRK